MTEQVRVIHRLDPKQLAAVRQAVAGKISINANTTPLQAGFQLGVQSVLNVLQEGFTVSVPTPPRG